jgi:hypothetical protein
MTPANEPPQKGPTVTWLRTLLLFVDFLKNGPKLRVLSTPQFHTYLGHWPIFPEHLRGILPCSGCCGFRSEWMGSMFCWKDKLVWWALIWSPYSSMSFTPKSQLHQVFLGRLGHGSHLNFDLLKYPVFRLLCTALLHCSAARCFC